MTPALHPVRAVILTASSVPADVCLWGSHLTRLCRSGAPNSGSRLRTRLLLVLLSDSLFKSGFCLTNAPIEVIGLRDQRVDHLLVGLDVPEHPVHQAGAPLGLELDSDPLLHYSARQDTLIWALEAA